ncbi:tripartite tricarboxylate transporter substrate-binding protein [Fodinicurvata sp. EGI_FJ10296]|uniref:Bug family tripartite tricarboxylate transporter substrate binding protein n=1 Tax=Fodinicurvata sp. EGI_FJ10296 TaxID=3231908 RepID=UPI003455259B
MTRIAKKAVSSILLAGVASVAWASGAANADTSWNDGQMRFIVGSSAGGGFDTTARQLEAYLEEELDANLVVENHAAGGGAVGGQLTVSDDSCRTILMWGIPHLIFSYMNQETGYTYDDFAPLAQVSVDAGVIRVRNDAPWENLQELIDHARENPGEVIVSAGSFQDAYYLGTKQLEEATGVEFNIVPFGGGSEARNALAGGHADMNYAAVYNSLSIAEHTRVLGVAANTNQWPGKTNDAPTINEALGTDLPPQGPSYGIFTSAACRDNHPDRYEMLTAAVEAALHNEEYRAQLEELDELDRLSFLPADEYDAQIRDAREGLEAFARDAQD